MTSRVAWAIVWVTWAMLLVGGIVAYGGIYRTLTHALDEALAVRAAVLPRLVGAETGPAGGADVPLPPGDRYVIKSKVGQTLARSTPTDNRPQPLIIDRQTVRLADGTRLRSVAVELETADELGQPRAVTVVYSTPTSELDAIMLRLMIVFGAVGICIAIGAVVIARWVARRALGPVNRAAEALERIDETSLGRDGEAAAAVDPQRMPPELRGIARRLREMLSRLETGARQRRRFLADAAHELRTPVAGLMTTLEVALRRQQDPDTLREMLVDALTSTRSMRRLVESLLEHARGELTVQQADESKQVDLAALLDDCIATVAGLARGRGVKTETDYPPGVVVTLPPMRLRSILVNLLSNAVEYTREGGKVRLEASVTDGQPGSLTLSVSDDGLGIAPEHLPHVFEPFYRAVAPAAAASHEHHGLGLFLVASHVRAMGGSVDVRSRPGEGACFTIVLPLETAATSSAPVQVQ